MRTTGLVSLMAILLISCLASSCDSSEISYSSKWEVHPDRTWIGPEYWANRLQDWKLEDGKLHCVNSNLAMRTVHLLTHQVDTAQGELKIRLTMGLHPAAKPSGSEGWAGILLGAGGGKLDYRAASLIHHSPGKAGGLIIAVNELGQVVFLDNEKNRENVGVIQPVTKRQYPDSLRLEIEIYPSADGSYTLSASSVDMNSGEQINQNHLTRVRGERIEGNIAIVANHPFGSSPSSCYWFSNFSLSGDKIAYRPEQKFGPFLAVLHTLNERTLKLTAQLPPLGTADDQWVWLWTRDPAEKAWHLADSALIDRESCIARFSEYEWESGSDKEYRLSYRMPEGKNRYRTYYYTGKINADPVLKEELSVAALSCFSQMEGTINGNWCDYTERLWFPDNKLITSVKAQNPDILFFLGDQIYEGRPTPPDLSSEENTRLDYLYKWHIFLWSTGELMRNRPVVCMTDDHDVYHGNLWGMGGKAAPPAPADGIYPEYYEGLTSHWQQDQGGYKLPSALVNMIQATQTSHLPDPYDPTPVKQGIEVYYTALTYGRISFAILEDRKFKTSPSVALPGENVVNGFSQKRYGYGPGLDAPGAELLGERQLTFLEDWTADWKNADMKAVMCQTIFANLSTYPDTFRTDAGTPALPAPPPGIVPAGYKKAKDMDSNAWPQTGRNKALSVIRKGFATMIAGDQHLGSLLHMGVERWDDAGYSFCVPAAGNLWPRRWFPQEPGTDHIDGMPAYTGKYFDGFGNRMNVLAVANPVRSGKKPSALYDRSVGYGIIKFNKTKGKITFECWKNDADPSDPGTGIYPGWPLSISLLDNYNRDIRSWLPNFVIKGLDSNPFFQVTDESTGEIIYSVRIPSDSFQPGVFTYGGEYSVKIGDPDKDNYRSYEHLVARYLKPEEPLIVEF